MVNPGPGGLHIALGLYLDVVWTRCFGGVYISQVFCCSILCDFDVWIVLLDSSVCFMHFVDFLPREN
jgi:hypothetical protein